MLKKNNRKLLLGFRLIMSYLVEYWIKSKINGILKSDQSSFSVEVFFQLCIWLNSYLIAIKHNNLPFPNEKILLILGQWFAQSKFFF